MNSFNLLRQSSRIGLIIALLGATGGCNSLIREVFPLLGSWTMNSFGLTLEYKNQINYRSGPYENSAIANRTLDFGTDEVTMGNGKYGYRREKVNGVDKVIFIDKTTNKDAFVFIYAISGNSLTLTSENFLTGNTPQERVVNAKAWAAIFNIPLSKFAYLNTATDASSAVLTVKATKN